MWKMVSSMFALGLVLGGCATSSSERVDPNSKHPDLKTGNVKPEGNLVVVGQEWGETPESGQGAHLMVPRAPFSVFDHEGNFVVKSDTGEAALPAGRYLIRTEGGEREPSVFWVTIESGKTTEIDTDRMGAGGESLRAD